MKISIIADDLTGANATAALLSTRGFTTLTCLNLSKNHFDNFDVVAFSTDSRSMLPAEAYRQVGGYLDIIDPDHTLISKRIDSTLRGNLGAEVDAVIDRYPQLMAIVVPVYPASGRICVGGSLLVNGVPLQNTIMRHDPKNPMSESSVIELFRQQTNKSVEHIALRDVLAGEPTLTKRLRELYQRNVRIVVIDATTDDNIIQIARAAGRAEIPFFCVDPGVFTAHLSYLKFSSGRKRTNKIFVAIGSTSELTQRQIKKLRYERNVAIETLEPGKLIDIALNPERAQELVTRLIAQAKHSDIIGIDSVEAPEHICSLKALAKTHSMDVDEISCVINRGIAEITAQILTQPQSPVSALYGSGGDVIVAITHRLQGSGVILKDEIEPLTVYGHLTGGICNGMPLITKGGFIGNDDTLIHCIDYLATKVSSNRTQPEVIK